MESQFIAATNYRFWVTSRQTLHLLAGLVLFALIAAACSSAATDEAQDEAPAPATSEAAEDAVDAETAQSDEDPEADEEQPPPTTEGEPLANYQDGDSDYLFDQELLHTFEIEISEENLAFLDADPAAEEYVEASLTFEGETLPEVGLRYKGSIGAFVGCTAGGNPFDPAGPKACPKLSMKVKINWDGSEDTFFGQKKLQFHAANLDRTLMRDRLGYHLFRAMGVPAPRSTHARLMINGEFAGLFAFVEQVDGRFTRANFDDGKGNLYKDVWPIDINGEPTTEERLLEGLKTNEKDDPSFDLTYEFANAVGDAAPQDRAAVVAEWMDPKAVAAYLAVDRVLPHDDGPLHIYCMGGPDCESHNFYFYEETEARMMHLIPWDLDNSFLPTGGPIGGVIEIADEWPQITDDCEPFAFGTFGLQQVSAACHPLMGAWAGFDDEYQAAVDEFLAGPFSAAEVDPLLDAWIAQISDSVIEQYETFGEGLSYEDWQADLETFRANLESRRSR